MFLLGPPFFLPACTGVLLEAASGREPGSHAHECRVPINASLFSLQPRQHHDHFSVLAVSWTLVFSWVSLAGRARRHQLTSPGLQSRTLRSRAEAHACSGSGPGCCAVRWESTGRSGPGHMTPLSPGRGESAGCQPVLCSGRASLTVAGNVSRGPGRQTCEGVPALPGSKAYSGPNNDNGGDGAGTPCAKPVRNRLPHRPPGSSGAESQPWALRWHISIDQK